MKRRGMILAAAVVLGAAALLFWMLLPAGTGLPASDWRVFRSTFLSRDGRVIDTGNGGISHSEGQGYGMLIAHAYRDRRTFDRIWKWTRENLQTRPGDKLLGWKWTPEDGGHLIDSNNATDGDLLVAWALVRAHATWGDFRYNQAALEILADLRRLLLIRTPLGPQLLPGVEGFRRDDAVILNPSYAIFGAFADLEAAYPGGGWKELAESGRKLLVSARFGEWKLAPEWVLLSPDGQVSLPEGFPPDFGYNAVRVPLYLAWVEPRSPLLEPFAAFWKSFPDGTPVPATVNLKNGEFGPHPALPGMLAVARLTLLSQAHEPISLADIPPVENSEAYYSATLKILVKMAILESAQPAGSLS